MTQLNRTAFIAKGLLVLAVLIAGLGATPARADFYSLEGRFVCLENAGTTCVDMGHITFVKFKMGF